MASDRDINHSIILYTDGASRGNPGPSAWAFLILDEEGAIIREQAGCIGRGTNNEAEYHALIKGLSAGVRLGGRKISVFSDSELVIRQMQGRYRVSSTRLAPLYREAVALLSKYEDVYFYSVGREHPLIAKADRLCNAVLDSEETGG